MNQAKTKTRLAGDMLQKGVWLVMVWLLISGCETANDQEIKKDAKWRADSVVIGRILDTLYKEEDRDIPSHRYSDFKWRFPFFNSMAMCKAHPNEAIVFYRTMLIPNSINFSDAGARIIEATELINRFQEIADSSQNEALMAWSEYFTARFYLNTLDAKTALPKLLALAPKFEELNDSFGTSVVSKRIGFLYFEAFADFKRAIPYFQIALKTTRDVQEREINSAILIESYLRTGKPDSARLYFHGLRNENNSVPVAFSYAVYRFLHSNNFGKDSLDVAYRRFRDFLKIQSNEPSISNFIRGTSLISEKYLAENKPHLAKEYLDESLVIDAMSKTHLNDRPRLYSTISRYYNALNQYKEAYKWAEKATKAVEAMNEKRGETRIQEASIRFEVNQLLKNQELRMERQKRESEAKIGEQEFFRNLGFVALGFVLVIGAFVISTARLRRRIEIEKLRSSISRDLHDDIGSTLSSIKIISGMALRKTLENNPSQESLYRIYDRSQRLLENMHDLVWSLKPSNDSMGEIFARMRLFAATVFEAKEIVYTINFPVELDKTQLSMAAKHALYNIFKELVNNIAKHAEASSVSVHVALENKVLKLIVEDNGIGFESIQEGKQKESFGGNGLAGIEARAKTIGGEFRITCLPGKGTKAELKLPV